jgi:hypothetical protein
MAAENSRGAISFTTPYPKYFQGPDQTDAGIRTGNSEIVSWDPTGVGCSTNAGNDQPEGPSEKKEQPIKQNGTPQSINNTKIFA